MKIKILIILVLARHCALAQTTNYKYDLYIDLHSIKAIKVDEGPFGDNNEDVFGKLGIYNISGIPANKVEVNLWHKSYKENKKVSTEYVPFEIKAYKIPNLTFEQLMSLRFYIGGDLSDVEINIPKYYTINTEPRNRRKIGFSDSNNRGEIERMRPKPANEYQYQIIKGGDNNYWEMDYYENGDNRKSHLRIRWQFSVIVKNL